MAEDLSQSVEQVIVGKHQEVQLTMIALLCQGHVLVEDVPGVGKTMLAKTIARSIGCTFKRIQFTPDLLPSDVTGVSVYNQKSGEFEYRPGPVMAQIVPTKLTAPHRKHSRHCWKRWKKSRSRWMG
jgi:MoxR-like ATPase